MLINICIERNDITMELSQLNYFLIAARYEHMTNAAKELHIAQPALTKSIHKLEQELGIPLFSPAGRNIKLTLYGQHLAKKLQPLLGQLQSIPEEMHKLIQTENTTIHMNVTAASMIIIDSIVAYKKLHPHINFHVFQSNTPEFCDIQVSAQRSQRQDQQDQQDQQNHHIYAFPERIFLAVPNIETYQSLQSISLLFVQNQGFAALAGTKSLRVITDELCKESGFIPNIAFESDNPVAVRNFIEAGLGIGFWPEYSWGPCASNQVILLPIVHHNCQRDILVSYNNNKIDDCEIRKYFAYIIQHLENLGS